MSPSDAPPLAQDEGPAPTESAPLLGRPGDALQKPDAPIFMNLLLGTAWLAQIGAVLLLTIVWTAVFAHTTLPLVSPHPLLNSLGVFTVLQAILVLQPTKTPEAKVMGQRVHAMLHALSFSLFAAGVAIIETNKYQNSFPHFHSAHAYLGVITAALLGVQYLFGFTILLTPRIWGGVDNAKAMWKYHRLVGYTGLLTLLATVALAAETDYSKGVLKINLFAVLAAEALIVAGVFPRIHLRKLGINTGSVHLPIAGEPGAR
ncbi:hypothetical protein N657DRAFT_656796 [Parathielavia appendiculata]|uniref:Cytochrome b561 domain-containing protein n=1 Tax=Parathielavia appendiculata TaxID=2587402 RepID=A0AAN6TXT1_9PEZI|nr:hypothetical protein N657DRAFT_656796 [Parathielavia appendiculata]